jgi:PAS domain S-box-containing protein
MTSTSHLVRLGLLLAQLILTIFPLLTPLRASADERIVTVGVYENPPKIFTAESGKPAGIFIDLIEHIASSEGWQVRYASGTWGEILDRLAKGEIDLVPDVAYSVDRATSYSFHKVPVFSSWFQVYAPKGNKIHTILDLNNKRILVLERSIQQEAFLRLSHGFGLNTTLVSVPDYTTMFDMVAKGEADAAVTNSFYGKMHAKQFDLEDTAVLFEPTDLFFAATKGDSKQLLASIDRHLADLKSNHQSAYYASLKRWTAEEVRMKLPLWLQIAGAGVVGFLIVSLIGSVILRHQVNARTRELHKEKEALRASELEYRQLVMLANSIILRWSPEGRITFLNEFGQRFFGYTAPEILGRHMVGTLGPEQESEGRDLRSLIQEISADPLKFERNINENVRRNGERVWIDWTNKMVLNEQGQIQEILSIGSDITARMQAEEQIRRLNADLRRHAETLEQRVTERTAELAAINDEQRAIFESAGTGIVLLRQRKIVRCNRKLEEISGYGPGELAGQSTRIWYSDDAAYEVGGALVYEQLASGQTFRREQQMMRKDGSLFWVRMSLRALDPNDPLQGAVGIVEDITDEREAAEKLRQAMEAAQAADRIKSAFLATMSHELRTPLNSIIGFTGIMLQGLTGPLNPEQHKQMSMVQKSSRHLLSLINDVLDISKIEAGQLHLASATFALRPYIEKMVNLIAPLAKQKAIDLQLDLAAEIGTITTDQRRLEQVILNLLSNALKFTEQGWVRIACRLENQQYILTVTDSGIGMRPEEIPSLFQPFHQIDTGLTRKHEGTGLGLSICQKIIDLMGGSIEVASQWEQGSTFTVRLPRQPGDRV